MSKLKLLGLALLAIFSLTIAITSTAQADVNLEALPAKLKFNFKSIGGTSWETVGKKKIVAASVSGSGEFAAGGKLGTVTFKFLKIEAEVLGIKVKCTGLEAGDKEGEVLFTAEFHLLHLLVGAVPTASALQILVGHVHFTCAGVLFLELGSVCSDDLLTVKGGESVIGKLIKEAFFAFLANGAGKQLVTELDDETGLAMVACKLEMKEGTSEANKYEETNLVAEGTLEGFTNEKSETVTALIDLTGTA